MTNIEIIHRHLERLVINSSEITALVARYGNIYKKDDRTVVTLLQTLAEHDPFFIGLDPGEFRKALNTYKLPLTK